MSSEREIIKHLMETKMYEDVGILPDEDDTIVRAEHHPISTADRPNISEGCEEELDENTYTVGDTHKREPHSHKEL